MTALSDQFDRASGVEFVSLAERRKWRKRIQQEEMAFLEEMENCHYDEDGSPTGWKQSFNTGTILPSLKEQQDSCCRLARLPKRLVEEAERAKRLRLRPAADRSRSANSSTMPPVPKNGGKGAGASGRYQQMEPDSRRGMGDILLRPGDDKDQFWIYMSIKLTKQDRTIMKKIKKMIDSSLESEKELVYSRCGVLFDICTTNSTIATGRPHMIADEIYRYIEAAHGDKTGIKFVFVGITDNENCRAGRDVLLKTRRFETLDNNHMYVVFPDDASAVDKLLEKYRKTHPDVAGKRNDRDFGFGTLGPHLSQANGHDIEGGRDRRTKQIDLSYSTTRTLSEAAIRKAHEMTRAMHTKVSGLKNDEKAPGYYQLTRRDQVNSVTEQNSPLPATPCLPTARPPSAANPLEGNPFIPAEQKKRGLSDIEIRRVTPKDRSSVVDSFFLTQGGNSYAARGRGANNEIPEFNPEED